MTLTSLQPVDSFAVPRFAGIATFMRTPYVPDAAGLDIALVGVPFDFNASRCGTRFGPSQVREMSRLIRRFALDDRAFNHETGMRVIDIYRVTNVDASSRRA